MMKYFLLIAGNTVFNRRLYFLSAVVFLVFSLRKLVSSSLGDDILLDCGFKHDDASRTQEVDVEWRLQHRGKGQRVFEMRTRMEGDATVGG